MKNKYDAIIVGGGHNGLTTAGYLGKAGFKTLVLERRPVVGGAVVTEEICPGYSISTISYVVSLLQEKIIKDLELKKNGFEMIKMDGALSVCGDDYLFLNDDETIIENKWNDFPPKTMMQWASLIKCSRMWAKLSANKCSRNLPNWI